MFKLSIENESFEKIATEVFAQLALEGDAYVEIEFVSEDEIREINKCNRDIDKVTDVLSFPMISQVLPFNKQNYLFDFDDETNAVSIGSIVICKDVAVRQAEEYGHSIEREKAYLFLHGMLHLLGYDHMIESDKSVMREKEEQILVALDIRR